MEQEETPKQSDQLVKRHPSLPNLGRMMIILDERLNKSKRALLLRQIISFKQFAEVITVPECSTEEAVLKLMALQDFQLILLPCHLYRGWKRVEAYYGIQRTSGPAVAGYFCNPISLEETGSSVDLARVILLDFCFLSQSEISTMVASLIQDKRRTGLIPLLRAGTTIYTENWHLNQGLGNKFENIFTLKGISEKHWHHDSLSIRSILVGLWSHVFDDGPGKSEFRQMTAAHVPIACLQVGFDDRFFLFRLCLQIPGATPKSILDRFWNQEQTLLPSIALLTKASDFMRVHVVSASSDVEIVIGLAKSSQNLSFRHRFEGTRIKSLWIEPISGNLISEIPFEQSLQATVSAPGSKHNVEGQGETTAFPNQNATPQQLKKQEENDAQRDKIIIHLTHKTKELLKLLDSKEQLIDELKLGGVGLGYKFGVPDGDSLLGAFEQRFMELEHGILDIQEKLSKELPNSSLIKSELQTQLKKLTMKESRWLNQIGQLIKFYHELRSKLNPPKSEANHPESKGTPEKIIDEDPGKIQDEDLAVSATRKRAS